MSQVERNVYLSNFTISFLGFIAESFFGGIIYSHSYVGGMFKTSYSKTAWCSSLF